MCCHIKFSQLRLGTYHPNKFYANERPKAHFTRLSKYTQEKFFNTLANRDWLSMGIGGFPMHGINRSTCSFHIKHGLTQPFFNKGLFFGVLGSHGEIICIYKYIYTYR